MRKLGQTLSSLARYRRHWSTLLQTTAAGRGRGQAPAASRSSHRTDRLWLESGRAAHVHLSRRRSSGPRLRLSSCCTAARRSAAATISAPAGPTLADRYGFVLLLPEQTPRQQSEDLLQLVPARRHRRATAARRCSIRQMIEKTIGAHGIDRKPRVHHRAFRRRRDDGGDAGDLSGGVRRRRDHRGSAVRHGGQCAAGVREHVPRAVRTPRRRGATMCAHASPHRGPWPRVSIWHGDADAVVKPINAESLVRQWTDVHGIDSAPIEDRVDGYPRQVWRRDGIDLVESYTITGMAHGTPLATGTAEPELRRPPVRFCSKRASRRPGTSRRSSA